MAMVKILILAIRGRPEPMLAASPEAAVPAGDLRDWLHDALDRECKIIHRRGSYPALADCMNGAGCDHDGIDDTGKAEIAGVLSIPDPPAALFSAAGRKQRRRLKPAV